MRRRARRHRQGLIALVGERDPAADRAERLVLLPQLEPRHRQRAAKRRVLQVDDDVSDFRQRRRLMLADRPGRIRVGGQGRANARRQANVPGERRREARPFEVHGGAGAHRRRVRREQIDGDFERGDHQVNVPSSHQEFVELLVTPKTCDIQWFHGHEAVVVWDLLGFGPKPRIPLED